MRPINYFLLFFLLINCSLVDAQVLINEYCSSTTSSYDEDGDNSDWLELYNAGGTDINLNGWHLTDDIDNIAKWTFPELVLPAGGYLKIFASGKDRYEYSEPKISYSVPLIKWGDEFSYAIGSDSLGKNWYDATFDDSFWNKGKSGFGYGNSNVATQVPEATMSVYVRKKFNVSELQTYTDLYLHLDYDDGFVIYINGKEVARQNLGSAGVEPSFDESTPDYVNPLLSNGQPLLRINLDDFSDYLVEGENVFAATIHNVSATSSDLLFIPFLTALSSIDIGEEIDAVLDIDNEIQGRSLHANFSISADGEALYLFDSNGLLIHNTDSVAVPNNVSRGLDASGKWAFYAVPTPASPNTTQGYYATSGNKVFIEPMGGIFNSPVTVTMNSESNSTIYYTTDGSVPTDKSAVYNGPIEVSSTAVFRAVSFCDSLLPVYVATQSYIYPNHDIDLPVFSLATDSYNLYDYYHGIYVDGPNASPEDPHYGANYHQDWERPMHVELYWNDGSQVLNQDAGVKIAGAWSRASAQKSFALHARNSYGKVSFDFQPFADKDISSFKSFLLRNSGNDTYSTFFRDALITGLVRKNNIDIQAYQPSVVYLNGNYWGMLNIREKINEYYVSENFPYVKPNKVDLLDVNENVIEGSADSYKSLKNYMNAHSMKNEEYFSYVSSLIDIDSYIEYMVLEIYCNNGDWPTNNVKCWHPQTDFGKWRWIVYDTDFGFGLYSGSDDNTLSSCMNSNFGPAFFLTKLCGNQTFKYDFVNRFADRLNNEFKPDNVKALIDSLAGNISDEMKYHIQRWNAIGNWSDNVNNMRNFADSRPSYIRQHVRNKFSAGSDVNVTVKVNDDKAGYVQLNSLTLKKFPWKGIYFANIPVSLRAVARPGYKFVHWEDADGNLIETHEGFQFTGKNTKTYKAVFQVERLDYNSIVFNEINYKSGDEQDTKDWIELYNTTASVIDISNWVISDDDKDDAFKIPAGTKIAPYGYLVICENQKKLFKYWPGLTNFVGDFQFGLGKADVISLYDSEGTLIDVVEYDSKSNWPDANGNGYTMALVDPFADNEGPDNWAEDELYGTPGSQNGLFKPSHTDFSVAGSSVDVEEATVPQVVAMCYPNPFKSEAAIEWEQAAEANVAVAIFTAQGTELANVCDGWYSEGVHQIDITHLAANWTPGLYFAKVTIEGKEPVIIKIVKQ